jgi:S-DNA-T family DNA segregation ATPase FtsK/SpoIIIE
MQERSIAQQERSLLRDFAAMVADRATAEESLKKRWTTGTARAQRKLEDTLAAAGQAFEDFRTRAIADGRLREEAIRERWEGRIGAASRRMERQVNHYNARTSAIGTAARKEEEESRWLAETMVESGESKIRQSYELVKKAVERKTAQALQVEQSAAALLGEYKKALPEGVPADVGDEATRTREMCLKVLEEARVGAVRSLERLDRVLRPGPLRTQGMVIGFALGGAAAGAAGFFAKWSEPRIAGAAAGGAVLVLAVMVGLKFWSRRRVPMAMQALADALATAKAAGQACMDEAEAMRFQETEEVHARKAQEIEKTEKRMNAAKREIGRRMTVGAPRLREIHSKRLRRLREGMAAELSALEASVRAGIAGAEQRRDEAVASAQAASDAAMSELRALDEQDRRIFQTSWHDGMERVKKEVGELTAFASRFPGWSDPRLLEASPEADLPVAVPFGSFHADMAALPGGEPSDERFKTDAPTRFDLPAVLDFFDRASLLIRAPAAERGRSIDLLKSVMLRILLSLPPGKVRFTIVDPVGLGESFAGFMHLADYEEAIVSDKIWTDPRHIEQKLTDLTEHMETVIQKYLRNEYESIRDYNRDAGEIAEPLRILVFADFPTNLSEAAAKRLASIATSGARCGVHTLIAAEARGKLPGWVPVADLERSSVVLKWDTDSEQFVWQDEVFSNWVLDTEAAPGEARLTELVHHAGVRAKDTTRVQVPFEAIAPQNGDVWSMSAAEDIRVPLGRSGAKKIQHLVLGRGTAQHALVAGRTGSGKSTLFHVLITALGLWYSPEEIELYLVDFKKGVEFKTYAAHQLPHARVVAVESEREFGISVLKRLDAELTTRGGLFRDAGVQDMAGYRRWAKANGRARLPRVLFLVDEFQEFFVEDDKIAQEAGLLLDRLVRQGRAFGMHVVLGSQTLGGAYSIARSTIGQMAVRIALQCSEADSYLIMSEDNPAPRLLSRPGEAIYNDASGLVEGNSPFQIVWLPDDKRDVYLSRVNETLEATHAPRPPAPVVFEGNVPADIARNHLLEETLTGAAPVRASSPRLWLGEAISIKDPTSVAFRRQSGANMLVVGQQEEGAASLLTGAIIGLAPYTRLSPAARLVLLDASPEEVHAAAELRRVAGLLGGRVATVRDTAAVMGELAAELDRREADPAVAAAPVLVVINALQRFRELRKGDDYGFSLSDETPTTPAQVLARLLREGPSSGIHIIAWVDTVNNMERALDRSLLKEFEARVLFQMSATDSTTLIDTPQAATLGRHRALLYQEEQAAVEKFRPYAPPEPGWVRRAVSGISGTRA